MCCSRVFYGAGEGLQRYLQHYRALSTMNLNPQKHWQIWTYMSLLTLSLKKEESFSDPDAVAKSAQKAARNSYRLPKTVNDSLNQVLSISITSMKGIGISKKKFDKN